MECLICQKKIKSDEPILIATSVIYNGPSDHDITYQAGLDDFGGAMHQECLLKSTETARTANTVVPESVEVNSAVQRSDALAIFDGV